jgi:glycosyltransferase involved in cell wall biosynthesis
MYNKISLVIPVYNEEKTLVQLLEKVEAVDFGNIEKEIILVNDGSKDKTSEILKKYENKPGYKVIHNPQNMGKSQSVRNGIINSTGDLVVIQDADLEYDPENLKAFVELFQQDKVDLIYGNRFGKKNKVVYWQNWFGNKFLSLFSTLFTYPKASIWTSDMEVCYKMANGEVFREIGKSIESKSTFGLEPELTAKFARARLNGKKLRFKQIPIDYYPRDAASGKKMNAFRDGFKAIWEIVKFNMFK